MKSASDQEVPAPQGGIHFEETIDAITRLNAEHHANATQHQLMAARLTALLGRPVFLFGLTGVICVWVVSNSVAETLGFHAFDPPPFSLLSVASSLASLYFVLLILTTQRRFDRLNSRRESLNMELAILNGQMSAKTIALLEELRRDTPHVPDRVDPLAEDMARPADTQTVFEAIRETRADAIADDLDEPT